MDSCPFFGRIPRAWPRRECRAGEQSRASRGERTAMIHHGRAHAVRAEVDGSTQEGPARVNLASRRDGQQQKRRDAALLVARAMDLFTCRSVPLTLVFFFCFTALYVPYGCVFLDSLSGCVWRVLWRLCSVQSRRRPLWIRVVTAACCITFHRCCQRHCQSSSSKSAWRVAAGFDRSRPVYILPHPVM